MQKFGFLAYNYILSSFTVLDISLNLTVGSSWNFTKGLPTYVFILSYNFKTIRTHKGLKYKIAVSGQCIKNRKINYGVTKEGLSSLVGDK